MKGLQFRLPALRFVKFLRVVKRRESWISREGYRQVISKGLQKVSKRLNVAEGKGSTVTCKGLTMTEGKGQPT